MSKNVMSPKASHVAPHEPPPHDLPPRYESACPTTPSDKYKIAEEEPSVGRKAKMIVGHSLLGAAILVLLMFLVRTSVAEATGTVVSNRVNSVIMKNRMEEQYMHSVRKRDISPNDENMAKANTDVKNDILQQQHPKSKPEGRLMHAIRKRDTSAPKTSKEEKKKEDKKKEDKNGKDNGKGAVSTVQAALNVIIVMGIVAFLVPQV